jgi:hypothetical protein
MAATLPTDWPIPILIPGAAPVYPLPPTRDGSNPLERAAAARVGACLAALPVRLLVRICLWPETVEAFATASGLRASQAYNTLSRRNGRPYHATRRRFAHRLGLPESAMELIDRPRAAVPPGTSSPGARDGSLLLERLALQRARANMGAYTPGFVLHLMLWPFEESDLAREIGSPPQDLYNTLVFGRGMRYPSVRARLTTFLAVEAEWLDHLIEAPRQEPVPLVVGR